MGRPPMPHSRTRAHDRPAHASAAGQGAFMKQHYMPTSVIAVLVTVGIVAFIVLMLWGAQML